MIIPQCQSSYCHSMLSPSLQAFISTHWNELLIAALNRLLLYTNELTVKLTISLMRMRMMVKHSITSNYLQLTNSSKNWVYAGAGTHILKSTFYLSHSVCENFVSLSIEHFKHEFIHVVSRFSCAFPSIVYLNELINSFTTTCDDTSSEKKTSI